MARDAARGGPLDRLTGGEASVLAAEEGADPGEIREAVDEVVRSGVGAHGAFLLVEVWAGDAWRVHGPEGPASATLEAFRDALEQVAAWAAEDAGGDAGDVVVARGSRRHPPGHEPLLSVPEAHRSGVLVVGVEVPATWRDPETGDLYPLHLRRLSERFSTALRQGVFAFLRVQAASELPSYRALGARRLGEAVWDVDRRLAEISASFDPLLLVAPVNADEAWRRFRDSGFTREPDFRYRLLPIDPDQLKRQLYELPLDEVRDPAAWRLLHEKRGELDRQISLVADRNTPRFLHSSLRLFGPVDQRLRSAAEEILSHVPPEGDTDGSDAASGRGARPRVGAQRFAARARDELDAYRRRFPDVDTEVQVRPDLFGLMVSSGTLLIGSGLGLDPERVEPLIQHEVGTHVLTFINGRAQPLRQLAHGLADYDELQEGLGVLAEYLVDGLTAARLRLLAGRVLAVDDRIRGASFLETFRRLTDDHGFPPAGAYDITARVHPGGGHTRDAIYLRGLLQVVEYLRDGGDLAPLYIGKIALHHREPLRELVERGVLREPPLVPRFLEREETARRLDALRRGLPLHAMVRGGHVA